MVFQKGHKINLGSTKVGDKPDSIKRRKWIEDYTTQKRLEIELKAVQKAMAQKDLTKEEYKTLVDTADKLIKNIQLLGGKPTEIINDYSQYTDE